MRRFPVSNIRLMKATIKTLPKRQAVYLTLWADGWSYQDIAIALNVKSKGSVGKAIRKGLKVVRAKLMKAGI